MNSLVHGIDVAEGAPVGRTDHGEGATVAATDGSIYARLGVTILLPVRNAARTLASAVLHSTLVARSLTSSFEVLVVDGGSTDESVGMFEELSRVYPEVRHISRPSSQWYGTLVLSG